MQQQQPDSQDNSPQPQDSQPEGQEEAQSQESQAPQESSQADSSQEEGQEDSPAAEEGAANTDEEAPKPEEKHKRAGGYQRKIERLERERQMLLEALHAQRGAAPAQPQGPAKEKTPAEQAEEYVNSLVEQRLKAAEAQRREAQIRADFQRRTAEARAKFEDFDSAIEDVAHVKVSDWVREALLTSEKPGEIMYQLAKNPAELARLSALPPLDAAREIGRLEAKLASGASPVKPKPAARPPAPPSKVGGSAASTRSLEDLPLSEYKRLYRSGRR